MENNFKPVARKENIVVQESQGEVLVYDLTSDKAHCLNSTAAMVWRSCDGSTSINAIQEKLSAETGKQIPAELVWLAVDQLSEKNLLAGSTSVSEFGKSRREMIKKAGLIAVIALPIVSSLVAPKSALASTSCTCQALADCQAQTGCATTACTNSLCV